MTWLGDLFDALDERDRRRDDAHRRWLDTPEGREKSAEWQAEESRYGDR
jgi:hypothetical protein